MPYVLSLPLLFIISSSFYVEHWVENELYETADMIAYLGGILGLFFGCTLLTLAEFLMFGVDLLIISTKNIFRPSSTLNKVAPRKAMTAAPQHPIPPYPYPAYAQNRDSSLPIQ